MPRFGPRPDYQRRRMAAALRARGLSLSEVGRRMSVSKQAVHHLLRVANGRRRNPFRVRCRACGADINPAGALPRDDRKVLCLACLARHPRASFGQRLKSHRLAAGLTVNELGERAGTDPKQVTGWEHGSCRRPRPDNLARLSRALSVRLG